MRVVVTNITCDEGLFSFFFFPRHVFLLILTPNYFTIDKTGKRENVSAFVHVDAWLRSVFGE